MATSSLFPIVDYASGYQFGEADERRQWNTVLSFASYLLGRDAAADCQVAEEVLKKRGYHGTPQLYQLRLLCSDGLPEYATLAIKYQDELADEFTKMTFDLFRGDGDRKELIEGILEDLIASSRMLNQLGSAYPFTRFDAVCVFLRYAVRFEIGLLMIGSLLVDTFMEPFVWTMQLTTKFNSEEKEQLMFLGQSIAAFRVSPKFPCTCTYKKGHTSFASQQQERMNNWDNVFKAVVNIASGTPFSSSIYTSPTELGPVLCAWLMLSPRKRESFVSWVLERRGDFSFVDRLFSNTESPNGASMLLTFINANIEAVDMDLAQLMSKAKQQRNPLFDL